MNIEVGKHYKVSSGGNPYVSQPWPDGEYVTAVMVTERNVLCATSNSDLGACRMVWVPAYALTECK